MTTVDKVFTKSLSVQRLARSQTPIAPRGVFFSSCRAVHRPPRVVSISAMATELPEQISARAVNIKKVSSQSQPVGLAVARTSPGIVAQTIRKLR
jgi:hypothetical protein